MTELAAEQQPASGARKSGARLLVAAALILLVATGLRIGYIAQSPDYALRHDALDYDAHAVSIAQGDWYSDEWAHGRPTAFRPPGYPVVLGAAYALTGAGDEPVQQRIDVGRAVNVLIGVAVVALTGLVALQVWGRLTALVATAVAALYVPLITTGGALMSEPLFVAFMLGALAAALRQQARSGGRRAIGWAVIAGLLAGAAIVTRPNGAILLLPLAYAVFERRRPAPAIALVAAAVLVVTPWTVRNYLAFDEFVPLSTQLGSALIGTYNDEAREDTEEPASWRHISHLEEYTALWQRISRTPEPEAERRLRAAALDYIGEHPAYPLEVAYWNTRRLFDTTGLKRSRATAATIGIERPYADAGVVVFWACALLALAGAFTRAARAAPLWLWSVPLLMALSVVFLVVETPRYRSAIDPFVVLLAALALTHAARRARARP